MLEFDQSKWMKSYIDFNIQKTIGAKNEFKKDFFKLMNNSDVRKDHGKSEKEQMLKLNFK